VPLVNLYRHRSYRCSEREGYLTTGAGVGKCDFAALPACESPIPITLRYYVLLHPSISYTSFFILFSSLLKMLSRQMNMAELEAVREAGGGGAGTEDEEEIEHLILDPSAFTVRTFACRCSSIAYLIPPHSQWLP